MAKELPYFKFEPSEWDNGNIQLVSHEIQGVFINLCSMYWQRLGNLNYKLAVQKVCGGNASALDSLYEEKIIDIRNELIYIDFLDEQLSEFENTRNQNRKNALKRWEKKKNDASAMRAQCERNAIREEKRREEKKTINDNKFNFKKSLLDLGINEQIVSDWLKVRSKKNAANTKTAFDGILREINKTRLSANECIKIAVERNWQGFKSEWVSSGNNNTKSINSIWDQKV
jgi:hypothetical protein